MIEYGIMNSMDACISTNNGSMTRALKMESEFDIYPQNDHVPSA